MEKHCQKCIKRTNIFRVYTKMVFAHLKLTSRLADCVCCPLNESFGLTMPVKLLLALTKLDEIGGNLENTAPLPLFFCQPLNAERPILLCYSFS